MVISYAQEPAGEILAEGAPAVFGCFPCCLLHVLLPALLVAQGDLESNDPDEQSSQDFAHYA